MDDNLVPVLRMVERILVVGLGGMAIYLGYKLFFYLPQQSDHKGRLELPGTKIVLSRVGPGVFFLAFGAFVLIHNLDRGIETTVSMGGAADAPGQGRVTRQKFAGAGDLPGSDNEKNIAQRRVAAIGQVGELNCLMRMLEKNKVAIPATLRIAHHDAKIALLEPVWNRQAWGDIDVLEAAGASIKDENLKGVFFDVSPSCQR